MTRKVCTVFLVVLFIAFWGGTTQAQNYVGSQVCMGCHNVQNTNLGYNIYEMYSKSGHPYKLNEVNGAPPVYPTNTTPGVPYPPVGTSWSDFSYVIGGYGWKARFVKNDGKIYTVDTNAQYNLGDGSWVAYHQGEDKAYNQGCFQCHTTGPDTTGSWNAQTAGLGTFSEPGVRCEGCHGPGSDHIGNPTGVTPPIAADSLQYDRCGDCHSRGSKTNAIPVSGKYIRHHEQFNEMKATKHDDLGFTCATCHDAHVPLVYPDAADGHSAIKMECISCHPTKQVLLNGVAKANIDCMDCHMPKAAKSALGKTLGNGFQGDISSHIWGINTDAVPRDSMFTTDGKLVRLDSNGHAKLTLDFVCLPCHQEKDVQWASNNAQGIHTNGLNAVAGTYIGSSICKTCHDNVNANLGYNIWEEYTKSGHPYKLNKVNGGPPVYPLMTSPGVITPPGKTWDDFSYVIGGYGWKARFIQLDGKIFTTSDSAQYNLADGSWAAYHKGEDKAYNQACFQCHTTGSDPTGSWNDLTPDLGTFSEPGIRCEGCHGPAGEHVANPTVVVPPIVADSLRIDRCGDCHQRGGKTNAIPVSGNYIRHHEQFNEMKASKHGDGNGADLTCASCHNTHIAVHYPDAAGDGLSGIKTECATCHPQHEIMVDNSQKPIDCVDCHMPKASKSALGTALGNGWQGDVSTHIFQINTAAVPRDSMFTTDGKFVRLDANGLGAVSLDFVCLPCHQDKTVEWASSKAKNIHKRDLTQTTLVATSGTPTLDGVFSPGEWTSTPLVTAEGVSLNAMADGDYLYLSASWSDKTGSESIQKKQWSFDGTSWAQTGNEDRFAFIFDIDQNGTEGANCATMCHVATNEMKTSFGKVDAWHWKAARGNAIGVVDDKNWDTSGRHSDPGTSAYQDNAADGSGLPTYMATGDPGANVDFLTKDAAAQAAFDPFGTQTSHSWATAVAFDANATFSAGNTIPGYVHRVPDGDRASVISAGKFDNGIWTVEFKKPYISGDNDFTVIKGGKIDFTHDIFDNQGGSHALDGSWDPTVYTLDFSDIPNATGVEGTIASSEIPTVFALSQNYPNPFNPITLIEYSLPKQTKVKLVIYSAAGQEVAVLVDKVQSAGIHTTIFNGDELASGIYIVRMKSDFNTFSRKMLLIK